MYSSFIDHVTNKKKTLRLGRLRFRRLFSGVDFWLVGLLATCFFIGCINTGLFSRVAFVGWPIPVRLFVLEAYLRVFFFSGGSMSGWHISVWLFFRWLLSGNLFPGRHYPICFWCPFFWNLKVFAKIPYQISENYDIERFINLSYGEFEVNDIHLRCNLGQTSPLYAKIDFRTLSYERKRRMFAI